MSARIFGELIPALHHLPIPPRGIPCIITAAAADTALPLMLDRLKQADNKQAAYIPIQAINIHIQAEKKLKQAAENSSRQRMQGRQNKTAGRQKKLAAGSLFMVCKCPYILIASNTGKAGKGSRKQETDKSPAADRLLSNAEQLPA